MTLANEMTMTDNASSLPDWAQAIRNAGAEVFDKLGFPNERDEAWRHTNFKPITTVKWQTASHQPTEHAEAISAQFSFGTDCAAELVLVNGQYNGPLSRTGQLPRGAVVSSLASAMNSEHADLIRKHLGQRAVVDKHNYAALNTANLADGVFIYLPRSVTIQGAIHILCVGLAEDKPVVNHPRVLVICEDNVEATIVESYVGPEHGKYFTNHVTEIFAGNDCRLDHYKLQQESNEAMHVGVTETIIGAKSTFISHNCTIGGRLTRNDYNVLLDGEASYSVLNGLVLLGQNQHCDNHTLLEHKYPNCPSYELYKHVLEDKASGVFKGKIFVHREAQKTDAKQSSKTLLLSDEAQMNSQPALEIYADDVKCTHGSTTGPIDESMVFYLQTRGVSREQANRLLTYAFLADVTRRIKVEPVRKRLENYMAADQGLPQDFRIQELGDSDSDAVY